MRYKSLLLKREHADHRWENQIAKEVRLKDLDHKEILRTRQAAIKQRRMQSRTSQNVGDILDCLGLRINGQITNAAQVLYGTKFLYYPQCHLKMGRFRGKKITGEIIVNKQEEINAFTMVREGMTFLQRVLISDPPNRIPIPLSALREILLNAVIHRSYFGYGYIAIMVFDDRVEIMSPGPLPAGIKPNQLSGPHISTLRNPLIAEIFYRIGAVEIQGHGTTRVADECKRYGISPPTFKEWQKHVVVTFRAKIGFE